jgi:hypothetical protein
MNEEYRSTGNRKGNRKRILAGIQIKFVSSQVKKASMQGIATSGSFLISRTLNTCYVFQHLTTIKTV